MAQHKKDGRASGWSSPAAWRSAIATSCAREIPEIDAVLGHGRGAGDRGGDRRHADGARRRAPHGVLPDAAGDGPASPQPSPARRPCPTYIYDADTPRLLATPRHYAYVKIAEGCDYKCAFCIIPTLRGDVPQPSGRLDRPRGPRAGGARREGTAPHLAGHDLLRHRPPRARRARAPAARAERGRRPRVDSAPLSLPDDD